MVAHYTETTPAKQRCGANASYAQQTPRRFHDPGAAVMMAPHEASLRRRNWRCTHAAARTGVRTLVSPHTRKGGEEEEEEEEKAASVYGETTVCDGRHSPAHAHTHATSKTATHSALEKTRNRTHGTNHHIIGNRVPDHVRPCRTETRAVHAAGGHEMDHARHEWACMARTPDAKIPESARSGHTTPSAARVERSNRVRALVSVIPRTPDKPAHAHYARDGEAATRQRRAPQESLALVCAGPRESILCRRAHAGATAAPSPHKTTPNVRPKAEPQTPSARGHRVAGTMDTRAEDVVACCGASERLPTTPCDRNASATTPHDNPSAHLTSAHETVHGSTIDDIHAQDGVGSVGHDEGESDREAEHTDSNRHTSDGHGSIGVCRDLGGVTPDETGRSERDKHVSNTPPERHRAGRNALCTAAWTCVGQGYTAMHKRHGTLSPSRSSSALPCGNVERGLSSSLILSEPDDEEAERSALGEMGTVHTRGSMVTVTKMPCEGGEDAGHRWVRGAQMAKQPVTPDTRHDRQSPKDEEQTEEPQTMTPPQQDEGTQLQQTASMITAHSTAVHARNAWNSDVATERLLEHLFGLATAEHHACLLHTAFDAFYTVLVAIPASIFLETHDRVMVCMRRDLFVCHCIETFTQEARGLLMARPIRRPPPPRALCATRDGQPHTFLTDSAAEPARQCREKVSSRASMLDTTQVRLGAFVIKKRSGAASTGGTLHEEATSAPVATADVAIKAHGGNGSSGDPLHGSSSSSSISHCGASRRGGGTTVMHKAACRYGFVVHTREPRAIRVSHDLVGQLKQSSCPVTAPSSTPTMSLGGGNAAACEGEVPVLHPLKRVSSTATPRQESLPTSLCGLLLSSQQKLSVRRESLNVSHTHESGTRAKEVNDTGKMVKHIRTVMPRLFSRQSVVSLPRRRTPPRVPDEDRFFSFGS